MNNELYYITCLTNLHVGSGDANYNIIDKEVEKDPITGYPTIHASGIKGALKDLYKGSYKDSIFGISTTSTSAASDSSGAFKFVNASLLYRPMRAKGDVPYVNVTTLNILNDFIKFAENFGIKISLAVPDKIDFGNNKFMASKANVSVEGELTGALDDPTVKALKAVLGDNFAIAKSFDGFELPVIARNNLTEQRNLWYEEYVPHGSRFYFLVISPDNTNLEYDIPTQVQLGGNSSIGYGYCELKRVGGNKDNEQAQG